MADEIMVPKEYLRQLQNSQKVEIVLQPYTNPAVKSILIIGLLSIAGIVLWALGNF